MANVAANPVDLTGLNRLLLDLQAVTGEDMGELLRQEARLWLKQVFRFTPPPGASGKAKKSGQMAVQDDIKRIVVGLERGFVERAIESNGGSGEFIDSYLTKKDGATINLQWEKAQLTEDGLHRYHQRMRNARGRTLSPRNSKTQDRWRAKFVVPYDVRAKYIAKVKGRVGYLRSGWNRALVGLGMKPPPWVRNHKAPGAFHEKIDKSNDQFIEFANAGRGIRAIDHAVSSATRTRERNLAKRIKHALNGQATTYNRSRRVRRQVPKAPPVSA